MIVMGNMEDCLDRVAKRLLKTFSELSSLLDAGIEFERTARDEKPVFSYREPTGMTNRYPFFTIRTPQASLVGEKYIWGSFMIRSIQQGFQEDMPKHLQGKPPCGGHCQSF